MSTFWLLLPIVACLSLAFGLTIRRAAQTSRYASVIAAVSILASGIALAARVLDGSQPTALGGLLRADALSAFMLIVVGSVGLTAAWGGLGRRSAPDRGWSYSVLVCLFLGAMSLAVLGDNLGVMWVAIEATTIATAFLVGYRRSRAALEAAWKYVILGSVGVAIAFLGIVILYAATLSAGMPTLSWLALHNSHTALDPSLVKIAAGLTVLGFATKAGLAPMHSWLPDAHSQAPAPVSGLMSGVLLSVAFYAILRIQSIANPIIGPGFMRGMLVSAGILSLTVSAALILRQRDLKRLLAYSSIEHMGLLAFAAGVGGTLALSAAMLHVFGHGLAKSTSFVAAGRILEVEGTTTISRLRSLLQRRPGVALPLLMGTGALLGLPPFSLFFSEVGIVLAGFNRGLAWASAAVVILVLLIFGALFRHLSVIMLGPSELPTPSLITDRSGHGPRIPLYLALGATAVAGFIAGPWAHLLTQAARTLGSAP